MKLKLFVVLAFNMPLWLQAQITVSVVQPPAGMIKKEQLWNLVLTNNSNVTSEVTILLNLKDAVTGQSVLSAGTRSLLLSKGVKMLNIQDIQPVQYNYGSAAPGNNFLPLGAYIACYTVNRYGAEILEAVATECVRVNITPLSPPLLNTPANKAIVQTPAPQLTWIPPAPLDMFEDLNYDVSVAEILEGQSPAEAILYNTPVYTAARLKAPYQNYPSSYSRLTAGKTYAWQVTARNGEQYAALTEAWTFTIAGDSTKQDTTFTNYITLGRNAVEPGAHIVSGNKLGVKYYSYDKTHKATIRLLDAQRNSVQEIKQNIIYGDNFFLFSLNHQYHRNKVYFIEITDLQQNTYTASFSIK